MLRLSHPLLHLQMLLWEVKMSNWDGKAFDRWLTLDPENQPETIDYTCHKCEREYSSFAALENHVCTSQGVVIRITNTLGIVVVCPNCQHQINGKSVTSQEWTDENGDVYFSSSREENPQALIYFIQKHSA